MLQCGVCACLISLVARLTPTRPGVDALLHDQLAEGAAALLLPPRGVDDVHAVTSEELLRIANCTLREELSRFGM